jgi:iron-sulfur cluster repair protein YtfE (RIC family)
MPKAVVFPSKIRQALLDDHRRLRRLLAEVEELAARVTEGEDVGGAFEIAVESFRHALEAHNQIEESHLAPLLRSVDAWGPVRVDQMVLEHLDEHAALVAMFESDDGQVLARAIPALAAELRHHMAREEKTFLSGEVLQDSIVTVGPTS